MMTMMMMMMMMMVMMMMTIDKLIKQEEQKTRDYFSPLKRVSNSTQISFLDASSHLYKWLCPSVRPSVRRSVGPFLTHS